MSKSLPAPGTATVSVALSHEGDPVGMAPREQTEAVLQLVFEAGMRAGNFLASFRHTHLAWFPPQSAVADPGPTRPTWIVTVEDGLFQVILFQVILVQDVRKGPVFLWRKAWLLRINSHGQGVS